MDSIAFAYGDGLSNVVDTEEDDVEDVPEDAIARQNCSVLYKVHAILIHVDEYLATSG